MRLAAALLIIILGMTACGSAPQSSQEIVTGDLLLNNPFDDPASWETYAFGSMVLAITDGRYHAIAPGGGYIWALNDQLHRDVQIEVTVEHLGDNPQSIYGVMCRAHPLENGVGYYFLITADGKYGIRAGEGGRVRMLVPFTASNAIVQGKGSNTIRAVCVGDYLAMFVNGQFVAETRYDWLEEGYAGLTFNTDDGKFINLAYDNLTIHAASVNPRQEIAR